MAWIYLVVAGLLEVGWTVGLKQSAGFTRLWPSVFTVAAMAGSFYLLAEAMRVLPMGTAYAVWTGIGTAGAAILGMILFNEPSTLWRFACVALILAGIAGLKVSLT